MRSRLILIVLLLLSPLALWAAAPNTLAYQGNLATAGGQPITANLNISFRLYDVVSGGSALWTETQTGVAVDGGNFAVELGLVTPLPADIWGTQLFLGIQIAGDSEMAPRPRLNAAPYALRARGTMKRTIEISADGDALANGAALAAALASLPAASAAAPLAVQLDAGHYDLGAATITVPSHVTLSGRGMEASSITSTALPNTLLMQSNAHLRALTVSNTGVVSGSAAAIAIAAHASGDPTMAVSEITLTEVRGRSVAAPLVAGGQRPALYLCTTGARLSNVVGESEGGAFTYGLRADCAVGDFNFYNGLLLIASNGAEGQRGAYLSGGGVWTDIAVRVRTRAEASSAYGLRIFDSIARSHASLRDSTIEIDGANEPSTNSVAPIGVHGLEVASADLSVRNLEVRLLDVIAPLVMGVRYRPGLASKPTDIEGLSLWVRAAQQGTLAPGSVWGLRHEHPGRISRSRIQVECIVPSYNRCMGIEYSTSSNLLELEDVQIDARTLDPQDASNQTLVADLGGVVRIARSSLRAQRSPDNELALAVNLKSGTTVRVEESVLQVDSATSPNNNCAVASAATSTGEFLGNTVQGNFCTPAALIATCAGNIRRGTGFLASTCP